MRRRLIAQRQAAVAERADDLKAREAQLRADCAQQHAWHTQEVLHRKFDGADFVPIKAEIENIQKDLIRVAKLVDSVPLTSITSPLRRPDNKLFSPKEQLQLVAQSRRFSEARSASRPRSFFCALCVHVCACLYHLSLSLHPHPSSTHTCTRDILTKMAPC